MGHSLACVVCLLHMFWTSASEPIPPTAFTIERNEELTMWFSYQINGGTYKSSGSTQTACFDECKADDNCVSYDFRPGGNLHCILHQRDRAGCSNDPSQLVPTAEGHALHFKINNRCYGSFQSQDNMEVTVKQGLVMSKLANSLLRCSAMCQLTSDCLAAQHTPQEAACFLVIQVNASHVCRELTPASGTQVIALPCITMEKSMQYISVNRGYFGANFLTVTTPVTGISSVTSCQAACDNRNYCRGFSFDFTYDKAACRLYSATVLCYSALLITNPGTNWYTYVKRSACGSGTTTFQPARTTVFPTRPYTDGPPVTFPDYDLITGIQVRGGSLHSLSVSLNQCKGLCDKIDTCKGFDYVSNTRQCYLLNVDSICLSPIRRPHSMHYRKQTQTCTSAYINRLIHSGVGIAAARTALICEETCRLTYNCTGFDFIFGEAYTATADRILCWLHFGSNICSDKIHGVGVTNHRLKRSQLCPREVDTHQQQLQQAFLDIKTKLTWTDEWAPRGCSYNDEVTQLCKVIEAISSDSNLPTFKYSGTMPQDKKVAIRFETATLRKQDVELLKERVRGALQSQLLSEYTGMLTLHPLPPEMEVLMMTPVKGLRTGGTVLQLVGNNLDYAKDVNIGLTKCSINVKTSTIILCETDALEDMARVGISQEVALGVGVQNNDVPTGFNFTFRPHPIIYSVSPLVSILSGGIFLTVSGSSLDDVQNPQMITTVSNLSGGKRATHITDCIVDSVTQMRCPTPQLNAKADARRKRDTFNSVSDLRCTIGFRLDRVTTYEQLTGVLSKFSTLTIYQDPHVESFEGGTLIFVTTWPVVDRSIVIKGKRLTDGLQADDFMVTAGEARCEDLNLFTNEIECRPPTSRPAVRADERDSNNGIPIKVDIGNLHFEPGNLIYQETLWEYPTGRWIIIGTSVGLLLIIIISVCLCCCCCSNKSRNRSSRAPRLQPPHHREERSDSSGQEYQNRAYNSYHPPDRSDDNRNSHSYEPYQRGDYPETLDKLDRTLNEIYGESNHY